MNRHMTAFGIGLAVALALAACSTTPQASGCIRMVDPESGKTTECFPLAPASKRVDLAKPTFSHPTKITNPLHPAGELDQVIYGGRVEEKAFRTEFTQLPYTKTITWRGQDTEVVIMQYLAFSGGRIHEVALDWFAQADDGSVWYFGEDVFNYEDGTVADMGGTWQAGKDGPAAMIMPANPKSGQVYRPENIPDKVFEEVTIKKTGQRINGPSGPIEGAITVSELHMDNTREDKTFAPGYGEYATSNGKGEFEQASLAIPTDTLPAPAPAELRAVSAAVARAHAAVGKSDWAAAGPAASRLTAAWRAYAATELPELLAKQMARDVKDLAAAVKARTGGPAREAVLRVAQNELDLRLQYSSVAAIDTARVGLWTRQLAVDLAAGDDSAAAGDVLTLVWTWDRVRHLGDRPAAGKLDALLKGLKTAAEAKDAHAVERGLPELEGLVSRLR